MTSDGGKKPMQHVETPARKRETHVRNWYATDRARAIGEHDGWLNAETPIHQAYLKGRLGGAPNEPNAEAEIRWQAYIAYAQIMHKTFPQGVSASYADYVSGGGGFPPGQDGAATRCDEARKLVAIDSHMSQKDRIIVRLLCSGATLPAAVQAACADDFEDVVAARVRDALDALWEAVGAAKADNYRYMRMTTAP